METNHGKKTTGKPWTAKKHGYTSVLDRWLNDETNRNSQVAIGWTETYCKYLDYLCTVDISYTAPNHRRSRDENTITMKSGDPDLQAGPMAKREDLRKQRRCCRVFKKNKEKKVHSSQRKKETRQRDELDPALHERLVWLSRQWKEAFSTISTSSTSMWSQNWWGDDKWQEERWKEHQRWRGE